MIAYLNWFAPVRIPEGKVVISQTFLDSLNEIANRPPEIVTVYDTTKPKPEIIYVEKAPPTPTDQGEYFDYADSLKTPEVSVWVWDKISKYGVVENRKWATRVHVPLRITERQTIYQPVPMPYPVHVERNYQNNNRIRYYGMVGYGTHFTVDAGVFHNDRLIYGAMGGKDLAVVKLGLVF